METIASKACRWLSVACILLAASLGSVAQARNLNVGAGYNFIPGSAYVSLGYRHTVPGLTTFGLDAFLITTGKEERAVRPGPEFSLDGLVYLPGYPLFAKFGAVAGWGKYGLDGGFGVDLPLGSAWFVRLQDTYFTATEDRTGGMESENLISAGLHYRF